MSVAPTALERARALPGDAVLPDASVVMDRAFTLSAPPTVVWPWLVQLGKDRAGWYLPRSVERLVPESRRAIRHVDPRWQELAVGDVVPDWGGKGATFEVLAMEPPNTLLYGSTRGHVRLTWALALTPVEAGTRLQLRLRLAGVKRRRLAEYGGGAFDRLTIAGLAAGLDERLADARRAPADQADW